MRPTTSILSSRALVQRANSVHLRLQESRSSSWDDFLRPLWETASTRVILLKILWYNMCNIDDTARQLKRILDWRQRHQPGEMLKKALNRDAYEQACKVTCHDLGSGHLQVIIYNRYYDKVEDVQATFGDAAAFYRFRLYVVEKAMRLLMSSVETPIAPDLDYYRFITVDDLRRRPFPQPRVIHEAREQARGLGYYYPNCLRARYEVNVPTLYGWYVWFWESVRRKQEDALFEGCRPGRYRVKDGRDLAREMFKREAGLEVARLPHEYGGQNGTLSGQVNVLSYTGGKNAHFA
ncbi:uncharacterized protein JN550_011858 [Neoarthrinium moseri]|uniref:uncharacterized protein n=1 Tax=Neoarthrinium moseri TaxID=1658444 RepID=UPI001FDAED8E|nr:uncharacterized protein JN550_011858 [Neoarthrinium moseri]KAI1859663.1 hypothetical protein JN550_011858 [Neoarthrinium moseri]